MRVLFIGNSLTYTNDMPAMFAKICKDNGEDVEVTMLAGPNLGWEDHVEAPETRFNIIHGNYDAVVLQHRAHPQGDFSVMEDAGRRLIEMVQMTGARPILFMPWQLEYDSFEKLDEIRAAYRQLELMTGAEVAAVGEMWLQFRTAVGDVDLYQADGEHPTKAGSSLAAICIAETILQRELEA